MFEGRDTIWKDMRAHVQKDHKNEKIVYVRTARLLSQFSSLFLFFSSSLSKLVSCDSALILLSVSLSKLEHHIISLEVRELQQWVGSVLDTPAKTWRRRRSRRRNLTIRSHLLQVSHIYAFYHFRPSLISFSCWRLLTFVSNPHKVGQQCNYLWDYLFKRLGGLVCCFDLPNCC